MHCEDAARSLHAGQSSPELDIHLSACDDCRAMAEDLSQLGRAFAHARSEWAPSPTFRVHLPAAPWRRLAIAASLLLIPLAGWAIATARGSDPTYDVADLVEPGSTETAPSERETLGQLFLEEQP